MIINKFDKGYQTRDDKPNENWLGEGWYLVPDNSALARRVQELFPRYDFVLDNDGNLIDVLEIPKTEEEINQERVEEIKAELEQLDVTINRATEDLYNLTNTTPYKSTKEVIDRKEALRTELKELNR